MRLLGAVHYDPAAAVTASTASLLAMTALDTTNLRITFTIPAHGKIRYCIRCVTHGATTGPQILLGILNGATVVSRAAPLQATMGAGAAVQMVRNEVEGVVTGLTPGSVSWDAAYGVESVVASTGIKYGGPNNTTVNDAFGAFQFEVYDPDPYPTNFSADSIDANGRRDVIKIAGVTQTGLDIAGNYTAARAANLDNLSGDAFVRLGAPAGASVSADVAAVNAKTTNLPASPAAVGSAMTLTAGERTTTAGVIWATVMTGTTTGIQAMRGFIAALLGKASGLDTLAPKYRDIADSKDVISATTDANGNRTAVTLDLT